MRIVIAPQEFKGSLTAREAAAAMAAGARDADPAADIDLAPMSDGGAGLVDALLSALGGELVETRARDPLLRPVTARWARLTDGTAAIEMAAASGLVLLAAGERNPLVASTAGTGDLIRAALDRGAARIIVGVGGSATVDAGAGAMEALGARLLDAAGAALPPGGAALARLGRIDLRGVDARLRGTPLRVACDVTNPLYGAEGAAAVYGPQKGASPADVAALDAALRRFAEVVRRDTGIDLQSMAGSGAAGGLAAGLVVACGASIEPGFPIVAAAASLGARIAAADLVLTGEGHLDAQTGYGKTAARVAAMARAHGVRIIAIAGRVDAGLDAPGAGFDRAISATPAGMDTATAMRDAASLVRAAAARAVREAAAG